MSYEGTPIMSCDVRAQLSVLIDLGSLSGNPLCCEHCEAITTLKRPDWASQASGAMQGWCSSRLR